MLYRSQVIQPYKADVAIFSGKPLLSVDFSLSSNNSVIKYILPDAESCEEHDAI